MNFLRLHSKKAVALLTACFVVSAFNTTFAADKKGGKKFMHRECGPLELYKGQPVKYVFLFIGDGMAATQVDATRRYKMQPLAIDSLPVKGLTYTSCQNKMHTDSGAAATAIACGKKTGTAMLGVDIEGKPMMSVAAKAKKYSKRKVGILASCALNHATPAGFYANHPARSKYIEVGLQLTKTNFDLFAGGGFRGDDPEVVYNAAKENGFKVIRDRAGFDNLKKDQYEKILLSAPVLAGQALPERINQNHPDDVTLAKITKKAIDVLDNDNGFFIMVEGSQIDWSCHKNDAAAAINELLSFDDSVKIALDFAKKHPNETLIVVCGDHETGGMKMGLAGVQPKKLNEVLSKQTMSATAFNAAFTKFVEENKLVSSKDKAVQEKQLETIKPLLKKAFGYDDFSAKELKMLNKGLIESLKKIHKDNYKFDWGTYANYMPLTVEMTHITNQRVGISWTSYSHSYTPTTVFAYGKGSEVFTGEYQNTGLGLKLMSIIGVPAKVEYKK
ncbi:alkaline phosphatase [Lentisphaerota bacterium WC36G]|nr:alkaline phosphatase [Lentisphaerae bacterium WC36]